MIYKAVRFRWTQMIVGSILPYPNLWYELGIFPRTSFGSWIYYWIVALVVVAIARHSLVERDGLKLNGRLYSLEAAT